jgi:hypothetical protein
MSALRLSHRIRAWLLNREGDELLRRASHDQYRPSAHLTGEPLPDPVGDFSRSGWFLLAVIVAATSSPPMPVSKPSTPVSLAADHGCANHSGPRSPRNCASLFTFQYAARHDAGQPHIANCFTCLGAPAHAAPCPS